jgi:rod shape determining protein RodA
LQIYSATHDTKWHNAWWKQILWILIGIGLMWLVTSIDYHTLLGQIADPVIPVRSSRCWPRFAAGDVVFHSRRWITIPGSGVQIQISEFEKLVIILLVARYFSELKSVEVGIRDLLKIGGLVGIPTLLVMSQPDFGTGATYLPILAAGILLAGLKWRYLAVMAIVCALARTRRLVSPQGLSEGRG